MEPTTSGERGPALTALAAMFAIMAISNFSKPFLESDAIGFVLFGVRLSGIANQIFAPLFGAYLLTYAWKIWTMRRAALPLGHFYATYVVMNLFMFSQFEGRAAGAKNGMLAGLAYHAVALGVSLTSAVLLTRRKDDLS